MLKSLWTMISVLVFVMAGTTAPAQLTTSDDQVNPQQQPRRRGPPPNGGYYNNGGQQGMGGPQGPPPNQPIAQTQDQQGAAGNGQSVYQQTVASLASKGSITQCTNERVYVCQSEMVLLCVSQGANQFDDYMLTKKADCREPARSVIYSNEIAPREFYDRYRVDANNNAHEPADEKDTAPFRCGAANARGDAPCRYSTVIHIGPGKYSDDEINHIVGQVSVAKGVYYVDPKISGPDSGPDGEGPARPHLTEKEKKKLEKERKKGTLPPPPPRAKYTDVYDRNNSARVAWDHGQDYGARNGRDPDDTAPVRTITAIPQTDVTVATAGKGNADVVSCTNPKEFPVNIKNHGLECYLPLECELNEPGIEGSTGYFWMASERVKGYSNKELMSDSFVSEHAMGTQGCKPETVKVDHRPRQEITAWSLDHGICYDRDPEACPAGLPHITRACSKFDYHHIDYSKCPDFDSCWPPLKKRDMASCNAKCKLEDCYNMYKGPTKDDARSAAPYDASQLRQGFAESRVSSRIETMTAQLNKTMSALAAVDATKAAEFDRCYLSWLVTLNSVPGITTKTPGTKPSPDTAIPDLKDCPANSMSLTKLSKILGRVGDTSNDSTNLSKLDLQNLTIADQRFTSMQAAPVVLPSKDYSTDKALRDAQTDLWNDLRALHFAAPATHEKPVVDVVKQYMKPDASGGGTLKFQAPGGLSLKAVANIRDPKGCLMPDSSSADIQKGYQNATDIVNYFRACHGSAPVPITPADTTIPGHGATDDDKPGINHK